MASALAIGLPIAASALSGYLASRNKPTQTGTSTPTLDPKFGPLQQQLINDLQSRLSNPTGLPAGYEAAGVGAINNTYRDAAAGIQARNQAAGIRGPAAGAPLANLDASRAGNISNFRSVQVPQAARSMHLEDMAQALNLVGQGRGLATTGTSSTGASPVAGALDSVGAILGYLSASGALGGNNAGRFAGATEGAGNTNVNTLPISPYNDRLSQLFG